MKCAACDVLLTSEPRWHYLPDGSKEINDLCFKCRRYSWPALEDFDEVMEIEEKIEFQLLSEEDKTVINLKKS